MERTPDVARTALVVLAVLGTLAALHLMKAILVPVALALLLACLFSPFTSGIRRVLPLSSTGAAVVLFLVLMLGGLVVAFLAAEGLESAAETLPSYTERLAGTLSRQVEELSRARPFLRHFLPEPGKIDSLGDRNRSLLVAALSDQLAGVWFWAGEGLMILILLLFLLAESGMLMPRVIRFFAPAPGDARAAERAFRNVMRQIRAYLLMFTLVNVGLGVAVAAALALLRVEFAVALGVMTALASFVPYIGQIISGTIVVLVALTQTGSLGDALIVAAVYVGLVGLAGYVVTPIILGRSLDLNGTTVLIACLVWGFLWGVEGLFLAIPITISMKLVFQHVPSLNRWAELMSRDWQTPTQNVTTGTPIPTNPDPEPALEPRPRAKPSAGSMLPKP